MMTDARWLTVYRAALFLCAAAIGYLYSEVRYLTGVAEGWKSGVSASVAAWQEPPRWKR